MFREGRTATELAFLLAGCMVSKGAMRLDIFPDDRFDWIPSITSEMTSDADTGSAQREANAIAGRLRQYFFLATAGAPTS
jgi:hypothetical protein